MVEYAGRARGGLDLEDRLQEIQHQPRQLELDSSSLLVVSDRRIHIVLNGNYISVCFLKMRDKLSNRLEKNGLLKK